MIQTLLMLSLVIWSLLVSLSLCSLLASVVRLSSGHILVTTLTWVTLVTVWWSLSPCHSWYWPLLHTPWVSPPRPLTAHWPQPRPARPPQAPAPASPHSGLGLRLGWPRGWPGPAQDSIPSESRAWPPRVTRVWSDTRQQHGHLVTQRPQSVFRPAWPCSLHRLLLLSLVMTMCPTIISDTSLWTRSDVPRQPSDSWQELSLPPESWCLQMCDSSCLILRSDTRHNECIAPWHCVEMAVLSELCLMEMCNDNNNTCSDQFSRALGN